MERKRKKVLSLVDAPAPVLGLVEWFRPGEYEHAEQVLSDLQTLGVHELRTAISWADWYREEGPAWYDWLLPRLARETNILPCVTYTPPSLGVVYKSSAPPKNPKDYADFLDVILTRYGRHFEWVELWNEPNNINDWDWRLDPHWQVFSEMIGGAAYWARHRGKKTVLAGTSPVDPNWLDLMACRGVLAHIDAVGIHGFPGTWEHDWSEWSHPFARIREVLDRHRSQAELWITEAGYSTWRHDEHRQVQEFAHALQTPVQRMYWYSVYDLHPSLPHQDGFHKDERHYHMGLRRAGGPPKLLYREWAGKGLAAVRELARIHEAPPGPPNAKKTAGHVRPLFPSPSPVLITGGAGFVGSHLAHRLLAADIPVILVDNLSRSGADANVRWLRRLHGHSFPLHIADLRDPYALREVLPSAKFVYHLAALDEEPSSDPADRFHTHVTGTHHLLESLRRLSSPPPLLFGSSARIYAPLPESEFHRELTRYEPNHPSLRRYGIREEHPLDFRRPDAFSRTLADQMVVHYAREYGLPAVVLRLGDVYGPHRSDGPPGGWIAEMLQRALEDKPIRVDGDGMQVRDVLYIDDLVDALVLGMKTAPSQSGEIFNIGGGPRQTLSPLELAEMLEGLHGRKPVLQTAECRGETCYGVSDIRKWGTATGWAPRTGVEDGISVVYSRFLQEQDVRLNSYPVEKEALP